MKKIIRFLRARIDFYVFLFRVERDFRKSVNIAVCSVSLSIISFLTSYVTLSDKFTLNLIVIAVCVISLLVSIWGFFDAGSKIASYDPPDKSDEYYGVSHSELPIAAPKRSIKLNSLEPCRQERELGFVPVVPLGCDEVAFTSSKINQWLSGQPQVKFRCLESREGMIRYQVGPDSSFRERISYLRSLVVQKNTINEMKYRLDAIPMPGLNEVSIRRVGYFDAMVTNQAVNVELRLRPKQTEQQGTLVRDFRGLFPVVVEGTSETSKDCLEAFGGNNFMAHSVGITTLCITADNHPVFFHQQKINVEGGGKLTALGSGSADFKDISAEGVNDDFLRLLRYGMVREAMEEGSLREKPNAKEIRKDALGHTLITGFFRWVRRGGKPEFIGVTRLSVNLAEIRPDGMEVARLSHKQALQITRLSDFNGLLGHLGDAKQGARQKDKFWLGLSSAMAIHRVVEVIKSNDPAELPLKQKLAELLNVEAN